MIFDNIIEKRTVNNGKHSLVLEISRDEFDKSFTGEREKIAKDVVQKHLINRGDDGRASNIKMDYQDNSNTVKIYTNVDYLGNDHTEYGRH